MMKALVTVVLGIVGCFGTTAAQCPATNFSIPATVCRGQQVSTTNTSAPGAYTWDFCSGDFNQAPSAQLAGTLAGANGRPGIDFAFDTKWHAFVTGTFSNVLYRLDFDNGLQNAPSAVVNLGSLSGALNQPGQIRIVNENGQWFGLLHNTGGSLLKLSFGASLSNVPTTSLLISGVGYINSGLAVGKDAVHGYVCVISGSSNQFTVLRLGNSIAAPNPVADVITSASVPNPNNLGDIDLIQVCGNWYGLADNLGNGNIYRLDFGSSLFSSPAINQVQTLAAANPGRIRWAQEGDRYYFLALALDGTLTKGDFGTTVTSAPTLTNEGNLGGMLTASMYGLGLVKENSVWTVMGVNQSSGQYFRINYTDNCSASPRTSTASSPTVSYLAAGTYYVSLYNSSAAATGTKSQSITVTSFQAPDIDFNTLNNCAQNTVQFSSVNASGNLIAYAWNFGDGNTSIAANPGNIYAAAGTFTPRLTVTASNGCLNEASKSINIFNVPSANFTIPAVSPICTNQAYSFSNTSVVDPGSNPGWEWRINGVLASTQADLATTFLNPAAQEIRLKAKIPGCENEMIKNIPTVLVGPVVAFSVADDCAAVSVPFNNTSTGADAGFAWSFGDGGSSNSPQPTYTYSSPGNFMVMLTASNTSGCNNQVSHPVKIYSVPQPDFSVGLPPFSCSNSPTLFQNATPPLTDSNITNWDWTFGDPLSSSSTQRDPSFTYAVGGTFGVGLTATTDQGCVMTINKSVVIGTSPVADFVLSAACVNQPTQFTDISSGGVQSRSWQIGASTFTNPTPTYTFTSPGNYTATLTVTATGGCTSVLTKPIVVPAAPTLVINSQNPCVDQPTVFTLTDATMPPSTDPVTGWQWNVAGTLLTGNPVAQAISIVGISPVSVTTTHASGCSYTKSGSVSIYPSPTASFTATPDRGDPPLTVQFQNTSTGASQYAWIFSGATPGFSTATSPVYTFVELGDYAATLTAINSDGCSDQYQLPIQVLNSVVDLELTAFSLTPDAVTGKLKSTVTIRNSSNIPMATAEVALHLSESAVVNETVGVNLLPGATLIKTLSFTVDPNQFHGDFVCVELVSERDVRVDNNKQCIVLKDEDFVFDPYPNPTSGTIQIDWVASSAGQARLTVFNSQGRREYAWETVSAPGLNQSLHDLGFLSAGVYFVTVQTSTTLQTRRFIRQ